MQGTLVGMTPVERGVALPHLRLPGVDTAEMVLVRARNGIPVPVGSPLGQTRTSDPVYAVFFLVSPEHDPARHLRLLAQLAGRVEEEDFRASWLAARDERGLQEVLLRSERFVSLAVGSDGPLAEWRGRALADIRLPDGCLVAVVRRHEEVIVPQGSTVLQDGDWLTIIGSPKGMHELRNRLGEA